LIDSSGNAFGGAALFVYPADTQRHYAGGNEVDLTIAKVQLPVRPDDVANITDGGWLGVIAGLNSHEIVKLLEDRWANFQVDYLRDFSSAILSRRLQGLSIDSQGQQWLSFEDDRSRQIHIAPPTYIPDELRPCFPFHEIAGLPEFLENFGGLADGFLPPCPWFMPAEYACVVVGNCEHYDWGRIGKWAGSLPIYNTGTGNFIVLSPENVCAKWDHDTGWESREEDPFCSLGWTMADLTREFIAYLSLDEQEAEASPFYYSLAERV
jgi:hypothetical protein